MNEALFCDKRFYELIITLSQRESFSSSYHFRRKLGLNTILRFDFSQNFQKFQVIVSKIISNQSWLWDGIFSRSLIPNTDLGEAGSGFFNLGWIKKSRKSRNPGDRDRALKIPIIPKFQGSGSEF